MENDVETRAGAGRCRSSFVNPAPSKRLLPGPQKQPSFFNDHSNPQNRVQSINSVQVKKNVNFKALFSPSERSGDFLDPNSQFQFSPNVQKLPVAPLDGGTELLVSIESLPRTTVPDILSILSASADLPHFASTSDCFGIFPKHTPPATPEPIRPKLASSQSSCESGRLSFRATVNELSAAKTTKASAAASKRLSGLLDDSGYAHSPNFSALVGSFALFCDASKSLNN